MSLVSLPNVEKIPEPPKNPLYIENGIDISALLNSENLNNLKYFGIRPDMVRIMSNFSIVATFLANIEDIKLVRDTKEQENKWWGFMRGCGKVYLHKHEKHVKPVYFV